MFKSLFIATAVLMAVTAPTDTVKIEGPATAEPEVINTAISEPDAEELDSYIENIKEVSWQQTENDAVEAAPDFEGLFAALYPEEDYDETINVLAKLLWGEARGVTSDTNKACVVWCVLNRVDESMRGNTVIECATAPHQFNYKKRFKVEDSLKNIAEDVLERWLLEKTGETDVGRVLPANYCYFSGNGEYNVFRSQYMIKGSNKLTPVHSDVYGE